MPIPDFDSITSVMPPHVGDPRSRAQLSPYPCTLIELCEKFASSEERKKILDGYLRIRHELLKLGMQGFQWLDGSFLENIELLENRAPKDVDVVTFIKIPKTEADFDALLDKRNDLWDNKVSKPEYFVDHFIFSLGTEPEELVELSRYWYGLFSHRRDRTWKGMLRIELSDVRVDEEAKRVLELQK